MSGRSVRETAERVRSGRVSACAVVEDAIRRHEASELGAYVHFDAAAARAQASAVDAAVARGEDPGPLAGVAVSAKDLYGVEGMPLRAGTGSELPRRWRREGFLVRAVRRLGGVIVGKTHTVEMAFGGVGVNTRVGTPINPWDARRRRVPGGSSAGAGVSLWEGSAMIALGTDTGGSVRIPASATGVVGFRHTTGRWPATGVVPLSRTLDAVGLLTRTAADLRYAFGAVDALAPRARRRRSVARERADVAGLRIGTPTRCSMWRDAEDGVARAAHRALAELEGAGAERVEVEAPELDRAAAGYLSGDLIQPELLEFLERELPDRIPNLDPVVGARLRDAAVVPATRHVAVRRLRRRLARALGRRLRDLGIDVLATPTLPIAPPPLDALAEPAAYRAANRAMLSGTSPASMLDMCAISVPAGLDGEGIPVGLHLAAPSDADRPLLAWAEAAESVLGASAARLGSPPRLRDPLPSR